MRLRLQLLPSIRTCFTAAAQTLNGGSYFFLNLYQRYFNAKQYPDDVNYQGIGGGGGIRQPHCWIR